MAGRLPLVVALGSVDPALVTGVFDGHCRFVPDPGDAFLARVKPGMVLVNCSRGGLIDTDAVWRALAAGRLSGVGLDVYDPEPQAVANPAWRTHRTTEIHP